jgi:hypothetical protein
MGAAIGFRTRNRTIIKCNRHYYEVMPVQNVQLKIIFVTVETDKSIDTIIDELVKDTILKVLTKHHLKGYNVHIDEHE